eukprot:CAMPEP_0205799798 /NCGR_PEP_ID=MMETSP0205-20121125/1217_1 /ASSEMBLY_ACC=CAM_ASM_000278 /TAXON_ID=36767 /ORGANISM="Euplotes focardii, Strain TN1" /LENGTH=51 /DNA_ID=CAMNT_0053061767 /DNA_START=375 /DNA_END=527 /DNA_ORIENTATION=+
MTPEDMSVVDLNLEARDYFSFKAMEFMNDESVHRSLGQDVIQKVLQEGIAD